ncbi:hypothetical protein PKOR_10925 [Pontibacter korlensis]|uniref:Uncharacterized protein n=1 Tax=Pontibacter korlensis TaxID=400092 RepID=A0A0E3UXG2_9BACT|nr:hypothetical protein [Pontibacter korlensis]AKD03551.1 hypothetical protein PKOR_10925 [Pontibacter korlensis]
MPKERLSLQISGSYVPVLEYRVVFPHGVDEQQQFALQAYHAHHPALFPCVDALVNSPQGSVVPACHQGREVKGRPYPAVAFLGYPGLAPDAGAGLPFHHIEAGVAGELFGVVYEGKAPVVCLRAHLSSWLKLLVLLSKVATWEKHRPELGEGLQTQAVKLNLAMSMPRTVL